MLSHRLQALTFGTVIKLSSGPEDALNPEVPRLKEQPPQRLSPRARALLLPANIFLALQMTAVTISECHWKHRAALLRSAFFSMATSWIAAPGGLRQGIGSSGILTLIAMFCSPATTEPSVPPHM